MQANNAIPPSSIAKTTNVNVTSSTAKATSVPASRPLQWPTGLTMLQQQRFQAEFERKRKELEAQQKRMQADLQSKHRSHLVSFILLCRTAD